MTNVTNKCKIRMKSRRSLFFEAEKFVLHFSIKTVAMETTPRSWTKFHRMVEFLSSIHNNDN